MSRAKNTRQRDRPDAAQKGESSAQPARQAAQLELLEGYQHPDPMNNSSNGSSRLSGSGNCSNVLQRTQILGSSGSMSSPAYPQPWKMTDLYGAPIDQPGTLNFNYDRQWTSLEGMDVKKELATALKKGHRELLAPVFPDYTSEQKQEARELYERNGMLRLFEARDNCNRSPPTIRGFLGGINPALATAEDGTQGGTNTDNPLIRFLANAEFSREIVDLLHPSVRDITALAFTCKQAGHRVSCVMEFWNFTAEQHFAGDFLPKFDNDRKQTKDPGVRSEILVITPITPAAPTQTPYQDAFKKTLNLIRVMVTIPQSFRHVVLDRLPFLDTKMVDLLISSMPNLETMSISRCDLLDVTKLPGLIDIIKRHPRSFLKDKGKALCASNPTGADSAAENGSENVNTTGDDGSLSEDEGPFSSSDTSLLSQSDTSQISADTATSVDENEAPDHYIRLDFSPFFFRGPNTCQRLGSFGVTYNEPTFHTPKAVVNLIMQCWHDAKIIGMDLVSDSSSFFSFVRRLPGYDCLWTLKARDAMLSFKREVSSIVLPDDSQQTLERTARSEVIAENRGSARLPQTAFQGRVTARAEKLRKVKHGEMKKEMQHRFYDDLMAATSGDDFKPLDHPTPNNMVRFLPRDHNAFGYWRRLHKCDGCKKELPRVLFANRLDLCWGCKMVEFVNQMESSNLRHWKRSAIVHYLEGLNTKKGSLTDVLDPARNQYLQSALRAVKTADAIWLKFMNFSPSDSVVYPPEPANLGYYSATYSRYRWKHYWPQEAFDYREGGPQHEDPFKHPNSDWADPEMRGGELPESFNARFRWSDEASQVLFEEYIRPRGYAQNIDDPEAQRRIALAIRWEKLRYIPNFVPKHQSENGMWYAGRDTMRRMQNAKDNSTYIMIHTRVESCLHSLYTPLLRPFDLDHPIPDKRVEYKAWKEIMERHAYGVVPAGHSREYW
ncbi:hypothetical protein QBC36DRAFT_357952 [Triangularia setosa]|uniref:Uncharacterized protein n=1 Tax=Triangularia setosa TaxID=2587417 RepID=A0AAN6WFE2_9PEZI|nr:hypothetical protein QBC36DRAFT_357952 [Podospora setosa]